MGFFSGLVDAFVSPFSSGGGGGSSVSTAQNQDINFSPTTNVETTIDTTGLGEGIGSGLNTGFTAFGKSLGEGIAQQKDNIFLSIDVFDENDIRILIAGAVGITLLVIYRKQLMKTLKGGFKRGSIQLPKSIPVIRR